MNHTFRNRPRIFVYLWPRKLNNCPDWLNCGQWCLLRLVLSCFESITLLPMMPSVLWCCWLGGRKGIRPVKKLSGGMLACWRGYVWGKVQICIWPNWSDAAATHYLLLQWIEIGFIFLVLPFWYWVTRIVPDKIQEGRKTVVCVCVLQNMCMFHLVLHNQVAWPIDHIRLTLTYLIVIKCNSLFGQVARLWHDTPAHKAL